MNSMYCDAHFCTQRSTDGHASCARRSPDLVTDAALGSSQTPARSRQGSSKLPGRADITSQNAAHLARIKLHAMANFRPGHAEMPLPVAVPVLQTMLSKYDKSVRVPAATPDRRAHAAAQTRALLSSTAFCMVAPHPISARASYGPAPWGP